MSARPMSFARRLNVRSVLVVSTIHLPSFEENMPAGTEAPSSLPLRSLTTPRRVVLGDNGLQHPEHGLVEGGVHLLRLPPEGIPVVQARSSPPERRTGR